MAILNPGSDVTSLRVRAQENARYLHHAYEEVHGSLEYFRRVLFGPYDLEWFVAVEPGSTVTQNPFLD